MVYDWFEAVNVKLTALAITGSPRTSMREKLRPNRGTPPRIESLMCFITIIIVSSFAWYFAP
jgi:hypothetical protein